MAVDMAMVFVAQVGRNTRSASQDRDLILDRVLVDARQQGCLNGLENLLQNTLRYFGTSSSQNIEIRSNASFIGLVH